MDKVSDKYPKLETTAIGALAEELVTLASVFDDGNFSIVELDKNTIGFCGGINTFARSKSALKRIEHVVIAIPKINWQTTVPFSFSDNPKFPFEKFAHINYKHGNYPPTFCLSRENIEDWYAEHTLKEYMELVAQWLRDAAKGKLMKITENDEFEPQRIHNLDCLLYRVSFMDYYLEQQDAQCCYYSIFFNEAKPKIACGNEENSKLDNIAIGVRLFAGKNNVDDTWYTHYPTKLLELYDFIRNHNYPYNPEELKSKLDESKKAVFFQMALLRPVKLIQKNTRINYLCFRAQVSDILKDNSDAKVDEVAIIDMTDCKSAQYLSKTPDSIFTKNITLLGCGAVGSKIAYHLHRSGIYSIKLVDKDTFQPHNVCRHALTEFKPLTFSNKAKAMKEAMSGMFYDMSSISINAYDSDAIVFLENKNSDDSDIIIDATASVHVMYGLDKLTFHEKTRIVRVALSEGGDVGITYVKIDNKQHLADYYMEILRNSITDDKVYRWLSAERKNSLENIRVGEGCHSNTMRISDDTISAHAALMSSAIRHIYEGEQKNRIILSFANRDFPGSMQTKVIQINQYHQFNCENDTTWTVRIPDALLGELRLKAKIANNNETGGYLFGHIDHKRHIIYPLNNFMPRDSKGTKTGFRLGTSGLKEYTKEIKQRSVGQMEYIGDWHSHPTSSLDMSAIDIATCVTDVTTDLKSGIGLCVITKAYDTKFFLISENPQTPQQ